MWRAKAPRRLRRRPSGVTAARPGRLWDVPPPRPEPSDPLACREFVELVTDYLEGALPRRDRTIFEAHLDECDGCVAYLAQMRVTATAVQAVPPLPVDPHTRGVLLDAFRELRGG